MARSKEIRPPTAPPASRSARPPWPYSAPHRPPGLRQSENCAAFPPSEQGPPSLQSDSAYPQSDTASPRKTETVPQHRRLRPSGAQRPPRETENGKLPSWPLDPPSLKITVDVDYKLNCPRRLITVDGQSPGRTQRDHGVVGTSLARTVVDRRG